jgi:FkbM family methyltransferase
MINRSTLKYTLKKILPKVLFGLVLTLWQKILLRGVEKIDTYRLQKFTTYHAVELTHKKHTFSLYVSPDNGFIDKHIFLYGVYEPFMLDLFSKYLKKGDTFIDIGANIGQHSMYVATLVGKSGHVHAFEPIPSIYQQLCDSVNKNKFQEIVHTHNYALGETEATEKLFVAKNVGGSSLVNDTETKETIIVQIKNGDSELKNISAINGIKIDVEGYEYEVLSGLQQTLLTKKPILFLEFSGEFYTNQGKDHGAKILNLLRACNYTLFDIEDSMKKILDDVAFDMSISMVRKQTNLLCIAK